MAGINDMTADLPCQGCGGKVKVKATELSPGKRYRCSGCGAETTIAIKSGGDPGRALRDLDKALKRFGK